MSRKTFTADLKAEEEGSFDFCYIDSSKYTGDITYTNVDNSNASGTSPALGLESVTEAREGSFNPHQSAPLSTRVLRFSQWMINLLAHIGASHDSAQGCHVSHVRRSHQKFALVLKDLLQLFQVHTLTSHPIKGTSKSPQVKLKTRHQHYHYQHAMTAC